MNLSADDLAAMVLQANLAPSVHNTQPTRWRSDADGCITVLEEMRRRLPVGDPSGRDADVSHGAAIEGFALACTGRGLGISVEPLDDEPVGGMRPIARLSLIRDYGPDLLAAAVPLRRTYRGRFAGARVPDAIDTLQAEGDIHLIRDAEAIAYLAKLNDEASLRNFRNGPFRAELLSWMRLSRRDPRWSVDGLNAEAMEMSRFEAAAAGFALRPGVFETLDRLGLAGDLVAEAKVVRSAAAIALFSRPQAERALDSGRRFYRFWLQVAALGLSAAPMAVLADDPEACQAIRREFALPDTSRLITAFRLGRPPGQASGPKPRLPLSMLLVTRPDDVG
jgi:nitroreductase